MIKKKKLQQYTVLFSLFILLILPTAIVGYGNLSTLVNKAFGKPFQKDESTFVVSSKSSTNVTKGGKFALKATATASKKLPFNHFAVYIQYDERFIDIRSINLQNPDVFETINYKNGFLIYPKTMVPPKSYDEILPKTCFNTSSCDLNSISLSSVTFSINGILVDDLTEQQSPIKMSFIGAAETESVYIWNEKIYLPTISVGEYIKNEAPSFTSEPTIYTKEDTTYTYQVKTTDNDQDPIILSLECPETAFCDKNSTYPKGVVLENNTLSWENPVYRKEPYKITVFANDGKSVTSQSFLLYVLEKDTEYFSCTYTPAIAVKILDYREVTPLVIIAESSEPITSVSASLTRDNKVEKTFEYTFAEGKKKIFLDSTSNPSLEYQFSKGEYDGKAIFKGVSGREFTCIFDNPTESISSIITKAVKMTANQLLATVSAVSVDVNNAPVFLSDPYLPPSSGGSTPGVSFVYGTSYSFTLKSQDYDGDPLQHTIVTKPDWAHISATSSSGSPSHYDIQVTGTPLEADAGSNLISISVNDGYGHFITKTWVINVDYPNNDIPRVYLTKTQDFALPDYCPNTTNTPVTLHQGSSFMMVFDVEDRHQIMRFGLYYANNLSSTSWHTYNSKISYKMRCMAVNTSNIPPGDYYFKLTATDGFTPPAVGAAYTNLVRILPPRPKPTPTPTPTATPHPTITSTPTGTGTPTPTITNTPTPTPTTTAPVSKEILIQITSPQVDTDIYPEDFQIVASVKASEGGNVSKKDIKIMLNEEDITEKVEFSINDKEKNKSLTIAYKPNVLLDPGLYSLKISAKDDQGKEAEVQRDFNIKIPSEKNSEVISFMGIDIEKKWFVPLVAVAILIGIMFLLPIILYFASKNKDSYIPATRPTYKPSAPPMPPHLQRKTSSFATNNNRQPIPRRSTIQRPPQVAQNPTMNSQRTSNPAPTIKQSTSIPSNNSKTTIHRPEIKNPVANFVNQATPSKTIPIKPQQTAQAPTTVPTKMTPNAKSNAPTKTLNKPIQPTNPSKVQQVSQKKQPVIKKPQPVKNRPNLPGRNQKPQSAKPQMTRQPQINKTVPQNPATVPNMKNNSTLPPKSPSIPKK